jgi:predicted RNA-binding Zn-ribbon protein involved in translation (DUF1610 family)
VTETHCPHCGSSQQGEEIPEESRQYYSYATHYIRTIGQEIPGVYDGVLYWFCPDCGGKWHRWPEGHYLRNRAEKYVTATENSP